MPAASIIKTGQKFNHFTIVKELPRKYSPKNKRISRRIFLVKCECGECCEIPLGLLKSGNSKSCGCKRGVKVEGVSMWKHPLYDTHRGMIIRCRNDPDYKKVTVCERWLLPDGQGFKNFVKDMGQKPTPEHSIDRIDNRKNYTPDNCRWATPLEQTQNRSISVLVKYKGNTYTLRGLAKYLKIPAETFAYRYKICNNDLEKTLKHFKETEI